MHVWDQSEYTNEHNTPAHRRLDRFASLCAHNEAGSAAGSLWPASFPLNGLFSHQIKLFRSSYICTYDEHSNK